MSYYYSKILDRSFEDTRNYVESSLQQFGFGIVSEIDMHEKFKQKLNVDFRKYKILGACSPKHAWQAVQAEEHIGLMLPCNVVLQEKNDRQTEVAVIDPVASMQAVNNKELEPTASEIQSKLKDFISSLD